MQNLPQHILTHFLAAWPALRDNPLELAARLQRRRRALLTRPPRAWCVALRAGDTRMTALNTILDDCHAMGERPGEQHRPHTVTITVPLVRRLIAPVTIPPPGEPAADVAARLGCGYDSLRKPIAAGVFQVHHIPPFSRRPGSPGRGKPVPLLYRDSPLDPTGELFLPPAGFWGGAFSTVTGRWHGRRAWRGRCRRCGNAGARRRRA